MKIIVPRKDLQAPNVSWPKRLILILTIYPIVLFFLFTDFLIWWYQTIYFGILDIPKLPRHKYIIMGRYKLPGLSRMQRLNCGYCEYANGVIQWLKAVANQTEIYSCAIKYATPLPGQEYQAGFYDQNDIIHHYGRFD